MSETKYLTCAETAKIVRQILKESFPEVKFSVRSHVYAGGASINVSYVDGPAYSEVKAITDQLYACSFNGMDDSKNYRLHEFNDKKISMGADFIFVQRDFSTQEMPPVASYCRREPSKTLEQIAPVKDFV